MQHHQNFNDTLHGMWGKSKNSKEQRESVTLSRRILLETSQRLASNYTIQVQRQR